MRLLRIIVSLSVVFFGYAFHVFADSIVWDYGPGSGIVEGNAWVNSTSGQNFAEQVVFSNNVNVTGYNYFSDRSPQGTSWHLKLLDDNAGAPDQVVSQFDLNYSSFTNLGIIANALGDTYEVQFNFAPLLLNGGTKYWIGISGNGFEGAERTIHSPGDDKVAQFSGSSFVYSSNIGDQMFQLVGSDATVAPLPGTAITGLFLLTGFGIFSRIRRQPSLQ